MSLIQCSECRKGISDKATSCPHCGNPIKPVTIEQTSKNWKVAKLISWAGFLTGIFTFLVHYQEKGFNDWKTGFGMTLAAVCFIGILISKFGAWWSNE